MSKQKFSAIEREAIWVAHEKKCAYTRELLDVSSFHVDHILPESLGSKPDELVEVKRQFGLSDDFDLLGFENLLPCKPGINLQKGPLILRQNAIHFYLSLAEGREKEIQGKIQQITDRVNRGKAVILLQQLMESGQLSIDELASILEESNANPDAMFQLLSGLEFADSPEIDIVSRFEIDELMTRRIRFGSNDHITSIPMIDDCGSRRKVCTCKEYLTAINSGFYVAGGLFIKMAAWLEHYSMLLIALKTAVIADTTFISTPRVGVSDLQLIPANMFPFMERPDFDVSEKSYQDLVTEGVITIKRVSSNLLQVESETMGQTLTEIVRADFNNDGIEDMLLYEYCFATKGTLGYGDVQIITRKGMDRSFEVITGEVFTKEHLVKSLCSRA